MDPSDFANNDNNLIEKSSALSVFELMNEFLSFKSKQSLDKTILNEKDIQSKCFDFLTEIDDVLNSDCRDEIYKYLCDFSQIFNKTPELVSISSNFHGNALYIYRKISEIDDVIDKLVSILIDTDIFSGKRLCIIIITCIEYIINVYRFFGENECIESLNLFISYLFDDCPDQEVLYCLLHFLSSYYRSCYEQASPVMDQLILPKIIESDQFLLQFLPTKENEMFEENPVLFIYLIFIHHEIKKSHDFSPQVQIIFDFLSKYISECQDLLIPTDFYNYEQNDELNDMDDVDEYINRIDNESISVNYNKKIEHHFSTAMLVYLNAISQLGGDFFDLYNHHLFPQRFIDFLSFRFDAKEASIDFIEICCRWGIDLELYLEKNTYETLIKLITSCEIFRMKVIKIIDNIININSSLISNFIDEYLDQNIMETIVFNKCHCGFNIYTEMLNNLKLVKTIIHFYPSGCFYRKLDICQFVQNLISILENGSNELTAIVYQILYDMYNHLLKIGGDQLDLFNSQFNSSGGIEISLEIKESFDTETYDYVNSFLALYQQNMISESEE